MSTQKNDYGLTWNARVPQLYKEFWMIQQGEPWLKQQGRSLFHHYREAERLLWPEDDHHRWSDLLLDTFVREEITVVMGCGASNKTYGMSRFILTDWWAFPNDTLWLISSTEYRGADLRVWGDIKLLFNRALQRHPWLQGHPLDSMRAITTQSIHDDLDFARSLKRGLIVVPNKKGNVNVGLSPFVGIRVPRLRHAGDEVQFMTSGFLDAYANWYGNSNFKGIMSGNPMDITDQLCFAGEPQGGWETFVDTGKTQTWRGKFYNAFVVALDGRDSPNFDFPDAETKPKFPYLIGPKKLNGVASTHGKNSWQWFSQCVGKPNKGLLLSRVITNQMCVDHHAFDEVVWRGDSRTNVYALDPAYGGGDRCVGMRLEFGPDINGVQKLKVYPPEIVPIDLTIKTEAEEQIAKYIYARLSELSIPTQNCGYDSFGKGTLGFYFAKIFGANTPLPIDSGAQPTDRPVRFDLFVYEDGKRRLKKCSEHYSKFVSEMWFSCAEAIMSEQVAELPKEVAREGCMRTYSIVKGNRQEVESKEEMKERVTQSPDLFDTFAVGVEMARRLGFRIERIGRANDTSESRFEWFTELQERQRQQRQRSELNHAA